MRKGQHGRRKVDVGDGLGHLGNPRAPVARRQPDVEGRAVGLLVRVELSAPDPMLAEEDPVVGVEDEDGSAELPKGFELALEVANGSVYLLQGRQAAAVASHLATHLQVRQPRLVREEPGLVADVGFVE